MRYPAGRTRAATCPAAAPRLVHARRPVRKHDACVAARRNGTGFSVYFCPRGGDSRDPLRKMRRGRKARDPELQAVAESAWNSEPHVTAALPTELTARVVAGAATSDYLRQKWCAQEDSN